MDRGLAEVGPGEAERSWVFLEEDKDNYGLLG